MKLVGYHLLTVLNVIQLVSVVELSVLHVSNGAFQRLLVRINEEISAERCAQFRNQLENLFTVTSEQLYRSTRGRLRFQQITVLLSPHSASRSDEDCFPDTSRMEPWIHWENADFVVGPRHPVLGDLPWAEQYGQCGQQGSEIHLSTSFISSIDNETDISSARKVLREWIKYRYGVFDEIGFPMDKQYPVTYMNGLQLSSNECFTARSSMECLTVNETEEACNETISSARVTSLLASIEAEEFCDSDSHNRALPTKQNVLCEERSIWEVMEKHSDFLEPFPRSTSDMEELPVTEISIEDQEEINGTHGQELFLPPSFQYVYHQSPRYVLVLDRTQTMAESSRWIILRRALHRWVHSLANDTRLSIVVAADEASQVLPWTRVTADNRDGLLGRIPRRPLAQDRFCLSCAIRLANQLLTDEEEKSCCGGSIVLVTAMQEKPHDFQEIIDECTRMAVTVHSLAFPSHLVFPEFYQMTSGRGYNMAIHQSSHLQNTALTQAKLTQSFLHILQHDNLNGIQQIYERSHTTREGTVILATFTLDSPLGNNLWITAHCVDEADLDTIEVISPSGIIYDLPLVSDGLLYIRIPDTNEFGDWTYRLRFSQPLKENTFATIQVTAQPRKVFFGHNHQDGITSRAYINIHSQPVNVTTTPIILYTEVKQGLLPVVDADVRAIIYPPNATQPLEVQLHDRGIGDPDITRGDGIYSGYFVKGAVLGHYSVTIIVTDNKSRAAVPLSIPNAENITACCGSVFPYKETVPTIPFGRIISGPSFTIADIVPEEEEDIYPPSRITDLRVEKILNATNEVELYWTAPGGNYDRDTASVYEIRCYTDRSTLNDSASAILVHASLTPLPGMAGTPQYSIVAVPWPNQLFYYAVVAVDLQGNRGKVSNIVPVFIDEPPPPPTTTSTPELDFIDPSRNQFANGSFPGAVRRNFATGEKLLSDNQLYAIAGSVAGFVLLLIVLSIAAFTSRRKRAISDDHFRSSAKPMDKKATMNKIHVEPLSEKPSVNSPASDETKNVDNNFHSESRDRPVYKIYVNNAYIQEDDGDLKILTPDGRIIQRGSPWFSTIPRQKSINDMEGTSLNDLTNLHNWSLPRSKASPHRHKVLTNGSIMQNGGGSQGALGIPVIADGTSISSKPSVSSEDTGIEVNDTHGVEADSRDSADTEAGDQQQHQIGRHARHSNLDLINNAMLLPPPGFGSIHQHPCNQLPNQNGYMPMCGPYGRNVLVPPLPASPRSQDARVVRIPSTSSNYESDNAQSWIGEFNDPNFTQPSSRKPLVGPFSSFREYNSPTPDEIRLPVEHLQPSHSPTSTSSGFKKKRHISFV